MKSFLKTLPAFVALIVGLAAVVPTLCAANAPAKKGKAGQRLEKAVNARDKELIDKLALTSEQQAKLAEIRKAGAEQLKAAAGDRAKMKDVAVAQHDEVRAMLTPEQQTKFDAMPAAGRAGKGKGKKAI